MTPITAALLDDLADRRHFAGRTLEIAKRLFVEQETPTHLALAYGLSSQRVYRIRDTVLAAAHAEALPQGWEEVTIAAPSPIIREIRSVLRRCGVLAVSIEKSRHESHALHRPARTVEKDPRAQLTSIRQLLRSTDNLPR